MVSLAFAFPLQIAFSAHTSGQDPATRKTRHAIDVTVTAKPPGEEGGIEGERMSRRGRCTGADRDRIQGGLSGH
jgi:hypothetical protein